MGLLNFSVPVVVDNRAIAVLYGGQFVLQDNVDRVRSYVARLDIPSFEEVTHLDQTVKCMPLIKHEEASLVLERANALAAQLSDVVHRLSLRPGAPTSTITEYLERYRLTTVLVLGKDTGPELAVLHEISKILEQRGYSPILAKDLPDVLEMSNEDKVRSLADASRFVLLENSFPAGQIAECKILSANRIVTAFLRQENRGSSFMVTDYSIDFRFMNEFTYKENDNTALLEAVEAATAWAEEEIARRRNFFNATYPWRTQKA
jgi:hypothetical protein